MRRAFTFLPVLTILLLAGCGGSAKPSATPDPTLAPPTQCAPTPLLKTVSAFIPGAKWIDTSWQPAEGTDLEAIYSGGGIACTYGIESAEVGGTFSWVRDTGDLYNSRTDGWKAAGQVERKIAGVAADRAFVITDSAKAKMEIPTMQANVLIAGFWIQLGGGFIQNDEQLAKLVNAAKGSLIKNTPKITGCYVGKLAGDVYTLDISSQADNALTARIDFNFAQKDRSVGTFSGSYTNGILDGRYEFESEGTTSSRELIFKGDASGFVEGYAALDPINGEAFARPLNVTWEKQFIFSPAQGCSTN